MKIKIIIILFFCTLRTSGQTDFEMFISLFPKCEWTEIEKKCQEREISGKPINPILANKNMWSDQHTLKQKTRYRSYTTPSPHIRIDNQEYMKYYGGYHGIFSTNPKDSITLIPLVRVELKNNLVLLVLYYKFYNIDNVSYNINYESYLFQKQDEKMLSAINLKGFPNASDAFLEPDTTITTYQLFDDPSSDDPSPNKLVCKVVYSIDADGYFYQRPLEEIERKGNYYLGIVDDPDGWVNVRKTPAINSEILYLVPNGSYVYLDASENKPWGKVTSCQMGSGNGMIFKQGGYVHLSRVKKIKSNPLLPPR